MSTEPNMAISSAMSELEAPILILSHCSSHSNFSLAYLNLTLLRMEQIIPFILDRNRAKIMIGFDKQNLKILKADAKIPHTDLVR